MRFTLCRLLVVSSLTVAAVGCTPGGGSSPDPGEAVGGSTGTGGARQGGSGGGAAPTTGGSSGSASGGTGGNASGGTGGAATGGTSGTGSGGVSGTGGSPSVDGSAETGGDASPSDGGGTSPDATPKPDAGPINLDGPIPPWEGPPVGPEVKMDCEGDPTAGYTEYKDTFKVEHPYDLPTSARFSIDNGIYNFWVMQGDKRHNPNSTARNPRTEARFSQNFRTGTRMFSADIYWDKSVAKGSIVMQVHTTTTGIGPVYMVANGSNVSPINGSKVPGGLFDRWINLKVSINAQSTASQYWVNNCLVHTQGSGVRGDGNNYFKVGVYHCDAGTCRAKVKNIKLYMK